MYCPFRESANWHKGQHPNSTKGADYSKIAFAFAGDLAVWLIRIGQSSLCTVSSNSWRRWHNIFNSARWVVASKIETNCMHAVRTYCWSTCLQQWFISEKGGWRLGSALPERFRATPALGPTMRTHFDFVHCSLTRCETRWFQAHRQTKEKTFLP